MSLAADECHDDRPPAPHLESPGQVLQEHREALGLSLDDIWRTTKINKSTLRAIEAGDPLHLPAAIYTRGFVKAYAREVGLDPDHTADEYLRNIEPGRSHHLLVDDGRLPPAVHAAPPIDPSNNARALLAVNQARRFGRLTMVAAAVGVVLYFASLSREDDAPLDTPTVPEISDAAPAGGAITTEPTRQDVTVANLGDEPLRMELTSQGPCWVSVMVRGETVFAKLLKAGDRATIDVSDEAVVRVGEPGALSYSINGQSGRALGRAGVPVTVRISKDNFHQFLSS